MVGVDFLIAKRMLRSALGTVSSIEFAARKPDIH
jgi:hypothetical protein